MKITKYVLERYTIALNKRTGENYQLDYTRDFGGYSLESIDPETNNRAFGKYDINVRITAREMFFYLSGVLQAYDKK